MKHHLSKHKPSSRNPSYKFLVSACLAGIRCAYDGKRISSDRVERLTADKLALAVCAEMLGGLPCPRENAEITGGTGLDVINKRARVTTISGRDVSPNFISGARTILRLAKKYKIKKAILKSRSPSCGSGTIHDGTFRGILKKGDGVLAALLRKNGIAVYNERHKKYEQRCLLRGNK